MGADWTYHFPQLYLTEFESVEPDAGQSVSYSVSESAAAELKAQKGRAEMARFRAEIEEMKRLAE